MLPQTLLMAACQLLAALRSMEDLVRRWEPSVATYLRSCVSFVPFSSCSDRPTQTSVRHRGEFAFCLLSVVRVGFQACAEYLSHRIAS